MHLLLILFYNRHDRVRPVLVYHKKGYYAALGRGHRVKLQLPVEDVVVALPEVGGESVCGGRQRHDHPAQDGRHAARRVQRLEPEQLVWRRLQETLPF